MRRTIRDLVLVAVGFCLAVLLIPPRAVQLRDKAVAKAAHIVTGGQADLQAEAEPTAADAIPAGLRVGQMAPDFVLSTPGGQQVRLSDLRGQPVFLNFWASWCPPCRAEMPHMQDLWQQGHDSFRLLAVNLTDTEKDAGAVSAFLNAAGYTFPVALDPDGAVSSRYHAIGIPTSYFLDANGVIRVVVQGPMVLETMQQNLEKTRKAGQL
jgi:thiol-disulfide isomerase/thioredoxin